MSFNFIFLAALLLLIQASLFADEQAHENDVYCGPRCVQFVLEWNGNRKELVDIITQSQWPRPEMGSSLHALSSVLEKSGVHAKCVKTVAGSRVSWADPVIVHLESPETKIGHFRVWLPINDANGEHFWEPKLGEIVVPRSIAFKGSSGNFCLTSRDVISEGQYTHAFFSEDRTAIVVTVLAIGLSVMFLLMYRKGVPFTSKVT